MFILSKHENQVGFFKSDNGRTLQAGKSYLYIENPTQSRLTNGFPFSGSAMGINLMPGDYQDNEGSVYNLSGQRMAAPAKGINIIGGRKLVIK